MDKPRFYILLEQFKEGELEAHTLISYIRHNLYTNYPDRLKSAEEIAGFWYKHTDQYHKDQWWFKNCKHCQRCCQCTSCRHDLGTWYQGNTDKLYGKDGNPGLLAPHAPKCKEIDEGEGKDEYQSDKPNT